MYCHLILLIHLKIKIIEKTDEMHQMFSTDSQDLNKRTIEKE